MTKNKIITFLSVLIFLSGYFVYDYTIRWDANYGLLSIIAVISLSFFIFSFSENGKRFLIFFKDVKLEFKKIHYPKFKEVLNGLKVVFIFSTFFVVLISAMDYFFNDLYNSLM